MQFNFKDRESKTLANLSVIDKDLISGIINLLHENICRRNGITSKSGAVSGSTGVRVERFVMCKYLKPLKARDRPKQPQASGWMFNDFFFFFF